MKKLFLFSLILPFYLGGTNCAAQRAEIPLPFQIDSIRQAQTPDTIYMWANDAIRGHRRHLSDTLRVRHNKVGNWQSAHVSYVNSGNTVTLARTKTGDTYL